MRVAIVYNQPDPESKGVREAEYGVLTQVRDIEASFGRLGVDPVIHAMTSVTGLVEFLTRVQPEVVFNCCESFRGTAALEASVASVYDLCGIAYTGSPALTLGMALDKGIAKLLFRAAGVPTPPYVVIRTEADLQLARGLTFPLIVKPLAEDASIGIDAGSVVGDETELLARVRGHWARFEQPALVEEFIDGREITVALLANPAGALEVLPVSDIVFGALPPGVPAIVSYDAKWVPESAEYKATPARCPADLDADLATRIGQVAVAAAHAVGLRDYGRVDLRLQATDQAIFVLEVNANPDLSTDAGFMRAAAAGGLTAAATVERILACAVTRARATRLAPSAGQR
jgi:D-alanine-D-alanine ligase